MRKQFLSDLPVGNLLDENREGQLPRRIGTERIRRVMQHLNLRHIAEKLVVIPERYCSANARVQKRNSPTPSSRPSAGH
jgi:hypothetical protein